MCVCSKKNSLILFSIDMKLYRLTYKLTKQTQDRRKRLSLYQHIASCPLLPSSEISTIYYLLLAYHLLKRTNRALNWISRLYIFAKIMYPISQYWVLNMVYYHTRLSNNTSYLCTILLPWGNHKYLLLNLRVIISLKIFR